MDKKTKALIRSLYGIAENPKQALVLVETVKSIDFESEWNKIEQSYIRECVSCDTQYAVDRTNSPEEGFCPVCASDEKRTELQRVQKQRRRATRHNLPATLTFKEWWNTLEHFNFVCAYCQKADYTDMEHFVPLSQSDQTRGTTANNVVPSCQACNYYKKKKNPLFKRSRRYIRIPESDLLRVETYLKQFDN